VVVGVIIVVVGVGGTRPFIIVVDDDDVVVTGGGWCLPSVLVDFSGGYGPSVVDYNNLVELSSCPQGTLGIDNARGGQCRGNLHSDLHFIYWFYCAG